MRNHMQLTLATTVRVLQQLSHDPRTVALLFVVPCVLLWLLSWMYGDSPMFNVVGSSLLGIFPFIMMFLVTSITTLRERSSGTLERILALPIAKLDIVLGYALAFGGLATLQSLLVSTLAVRVFGLEVLGPEWFMVVVALVDAILGMALGLFVSAFARTEFQAVQFMPAFVLPQFLLCGLLLPVDQLPGALQAVANVLPLTYAVDAMQHVAREVSLSADAYKDICIVAGFVVAAIILGAATLRRRTI